MSLFGAAFKIVKYGRFHPALNSCCKFLILVYLSWQPSTLHASFIESTMGAAVVNDATAIFYNPAALALLKNTQIINLNAWGNIHSTFTGQSSQENTNFTLSGRSHIKTNYYLPSFYLAIPKNNKFAIGLAIISNAFNKEMEGHSILRYAQSNNHIHNIDFVPALEFKLNKCFSLGASANISYANFLLRPISGFPSLNIPDRQSQNTCDGTGLGGDVGILAQPSDWTTLGLNYRSAITYRLTGTSVFEGTPEVVSQGYGFTIWTPARSVLSINQLITPTFGLISTIQHIGWHIFKNINIHGIAAQIDQQPVILNATVPYHLHDAWLLTFGCHYHIKPKWIIRVASSYNQSPGNSEFQISDGDSIILGASINYEINKNIVLDGSYAHAFIQNETIHVATGHNRINGLTNGFVDAFSFKLTLNL